MMFIYNRIIVNILNNNNNDDSLSDAVITYIIYLDNVLVQILIMMIMK